MLLPSAEEDCHDENDWNHPLQKLFVSQLQLVCRFHSVCQTHSGNRKVRLVSFFQIILG